MRQGREACFFLPCNLRCGWGSTLHRWRLYDATVVSPVLRAAAASLVLAGCRPLPPPPSDGGFRLDAGVPPSRSCTPANDGGYLLQRYPQLSTYCLVSILDAGVALDPSMLPYDLNDAQFSDYSVKARGLWLPSGTSAAYDAAQPFTFPLGTILTQSFGFPDDVRRAQPNLRWVETRLLVSTDGGWRADPYVWPDDGGDAALVLDGGAIPVSWIGLDGGLVNTTWPVPGVDACAECHSVRGTTTPIGPKARQLNRAYAYPDRAENQLAHWTRLGALTGAPADLSAAPLLVPWDDPSAGTVAQRARAYLEGNCAHCHNPDGIAASDNSLFLVASETGASSYGVCLSPGVSQARYDIDPGNPADSYVVYRMTATQAPDVMPPLGRTVVDQQALPLVTEWISQLTGSCP